MVLESINEYLKDKDEYYSMEIEDETLFIKDLSEDTNTYFTAIKLEYVKSSFDSEVDIDILDENGDVIGFLCLLKNKRKEIASLTESQFLSYIWDMEEFVEIQTEYIFKNNYVIIKKDFFQEYINNYKDSSMLWGGFSHSSLNIDVYKKTPLNIKLKSDIAIPTQFNRDSLIKATASRYHFERYLKYYHQLELLFNYIHVRQLKNAGDDLAIFNKIVNNYNREDIKNIDSLLLNYVDNIVVIEQIMNQCHPYLDVIEEIFFNYSKESNPLKDENRWIKFKKLLQEQNVSSINAKNEKLVQQELEFKPLLLRIVSYWIYRLRSSIAHNKIGEFILEDTHQEFLVEIGEELLLEIIKQIFSSQNFKTDTN